jgi:hypothetical protein
MISFTIVIRAIALAALAQVGCADTLTDTEVSRDLRTTTAHGALTGTEISKDFMDRAYNAAFLSAEIYERETFEWRAKIQGFEYLYGTTAVYTASFNAVLKGPDDVCYAVHRGTDPTNVEDIISNLEDDPFFEDPEGSNCRIREGFYENYAGPNYEWREEYDAAFQACLDSCKGGCPGVLTGHSQGGASVMVMSVYWRHYEKLNVITFGAPTAIDCGDSFVGDDRIYRFVMAKSEVDGASILYDIVPIAPLGYFHYGQTYVLSTDETATPTARREIAYVGLNDRIPRKPVSVFSHFIQEYFEIFEYFKSLPNLAYPIKNGFANGSNCGYSDECISRRCESQEAILGLIPDPFVKECRGI